VFTLQFFEDIRASIASENNTPTPSADVSDSTRFEQAASETTDCTGGDHDLPPTYIPEHIETLFEENSLGEIEQWLEDGGDLSFTFKDKEYSLAYHERRDKIYALNERDRKVDRRVEFDSERTVEGFIEIGGLKGLNHRNRLYIGVDPENNLVMIEAPAKLLGKYKDRDQLETLLTQGTTHYKKALSESDPGGGGPAAPDGTDLYIFDEQGIHHDLVVDTAKYFAGDSIQIESVQVTPSTYSDDPLTVPELAQSRQAVADLAQETSNLLTAHFPEWETNAAVSSVVSGLEQSAQDFADGTETIGDYLLIQDTLTFLRLSGSSEIQEQSQTLNVSAQDILSIHRENYPSGDPIIDAINEGSLDMNTSPVRLYVFQQTPDSVHFTEGYSQALMSLFNLSQQLSQLTSDQAAELFFSQPLIGAENLAERVLEDGLRESGLTNESGEIVPVPGFEEDAQPVRVINLSLGSSINAIDPVVPVFELLDIFPPRVESTFHQSLGQHLPEDMIQALNDGTLSVSDAAKTSMANAMTKMLNDPESTVAQSVHAINEQTTARVDELIDANIIVVMSSGNEANDYPGTLPDASVNILATDNMVIVGASDDNNTPEIEDDVLADFSSSGADFVMDGVDVPSTNGEPRTGTSFSAPTFSAWLALAIDEHPDLSASDILNILKDPTRVGSLFVDIEETAEDGLGILLGEALSDAFSDYDPNQYPV